MHIKIENKHDSIQNTTNHITLQSINNKSPRLFSILHFHFNSQCHTRGRPSHHSFDRRTHLLT